MHNKHATQSFNASSYPIMNLHLLAIMHLLSFVEKISNDFSSETGNVLSENLQNDV